MSSEVTVRYATLADVGAVFGLYDQVVEHDRGTENDALWRRDLHPSDEALEAAIAAGHMVVAQDAGGALVSAGIVNSDFADGYQNVPWPSELPDDQVRCLHLFCTRPDARGRGIAKKMLHGIADLLRAQDVAALRLDTFDYNAPARSLYEACGFVYAGPGRMNYEDQEVAQLTFAMYELVL